MRMLFTLPFLIALTAACSKDAVGPGPSSVNKTTLLQLVNAARKKGCNCGNVYYAPAPPVIWNDRLEKAAEAHSKDMNAGSYFSHIAPDGSNAAIRLERAGYSWKTYGENIASGYRNEQEVIAGWLLSPGHCKNIMDPAFHEMGVARSANLWTQVLATQ